jgi:hypothetical protein
VPDVARLQDRSLCVVRLVIRLILVSSVFRVRVSAIFTCLMLFAAPVKTRSKPHSRLEEPNYGAMLGDVSPRAGNAAVASTTTSSPSPSTTTTTTPKTSATKPLATSGAMPTTPMTEAGRAQTTRYEASPARLALARGDSTPVQGRRRRSSSMAAPSSPPAMLSPAVASTRDDNGVPLPSPSPPPTPSSLAPPTPPDSPDRDAATNDTNNNNNNNDDDADADARADEFAKLIDDAAAAAESDLKRGKSVSHMLDDGIESNPPTSSGSGIGKRYLVVVVVIVVVVVNSKQRSFVD